MGVTEASFSIAITLFIIPAAASVDKVDDGGGKNDRADTVE